MENIKKVPDAAGANFAGVLKAAAYLNDADDRDAINPIRQEYFVDARPASTLIGINKLTLGA
jgi:enamine deaminase RidA (YjgF/YER057c/UK114 family)